MRRELMLSSGTKLGPYEISSPIGAGGMGEVYKARDNRLDRTVAIKILPEHLAENPERRERFEREARAVSSLNHPHICTLHDIGIHDGIDFIVMEYLEGETLADRLKKGPLRFEDALHYGRQIADGLDKAHRHGVVHRDLKPGNIMLTKAGAVLLDFGLAKRTGLAGDATGGSDSAQPTQAKDLTDEGTVVGTFQYMAPEQLEGGEIDARTDLFAFGAVLYEMLTGKKAFTGKSQASLIGAILKDDPPAISRLQPTSPPELDRVLKKCLAKDTDERWASAHDVSEILTWICDGATSEANRHAPRSRNAAILVGVALSAGALGAWLGGVSSEGPVDGPTHFSFDAGSDGGAWLEPEGPSVAVSPDGRSIAFVTQRLGQDGPIWVRDLESLELRPLPETNGARVPFFSPDGRWIAYWHEGQIKKVPVRGGVPQTIDSVTAIGAVRGASWGENNFIYFNEQTLGIFRMPAAGGEPELLLAPHPDEAIKTVRFPHVLPGERALLYVAGPASMDSYDQATIMLLSLETGETRRLVEGGSNPRYSSTGHILYGRAGQLLAIPFDPERQRVTGEPRAVLAGVATTHSWGSAHFGLSRTGTLVYVPGAPEDYFTSTSWFDLEGNREPFQVARDLFEVVISPEGNNVAVWESKGNEELWSFDLSRQTLTRITDRWDNVYPRWTADGKSIAYVAMPPGHGIVRKAADGTGAPEVLLETDSVPILGNVSPDGRVLIYSDDGDIWLLPLTGEAEPEAIVVAPRAQTDPRLSPDGNWIAYVSDESGHNEIYVQPFRGSGSRTLISIGGGRHPEWRGDGQELFFYGENALQSVTIRTEPEFQAGTPTILFERPNLHDYDVMPDGTRFLVIERDVSSYPSAVHVVVNWFDELDRLVPAN
jgi:serine/threonine protein kinase/Tol biopolymer transport system component